MNSAAFLMKLEWNEDKEIEIVIGGEVVLPLNKSLLFGESKQ